MTPAHKFAALDARSRLARLALQPGAEIDLSEAALLVAAEEDARCDVARCLARLDELGEEARARIERREATPVDALNQYLFGEQGFAGNQSEYYDPRNSLLNYVLERRRGIPITLSIVYIEVGRRAGLRVEGVNLPGHFVVRAGDAESAVLVDPFHGKTIDEDECQQRLDIVYGGQVPLADEHLRPTSTREILVRLLRNLKAIYTQAHLYARALAVVERILLLAPHAFDERRDRGVLLAQLDHFSPAIADLQSYLSFVPNASDADEVREQLKKLQIRFAMLN